MKLPDNVTIDEDAGKADCSVCRIGVTTPPSFGGIPRTDMLAAFVIQHAVHDRKGSPAGLTPGGKPTKAAQEVLTRV